MNNSIQFEYCVPQSQKLADFYGYQLDLTDAIRFCDLHIEIDPTEKDISVGEILRREHTRNALCRAAFTSYGRCFGTGIRASLSQDILLRLPDELKQRHQQVKDMRDKWVAHSVNHFDDVRIRIDATWTESGDIEVRGISMASQMVGTLRMAWMMAYRELFKAVLALVEEQIRCETELLSEKVKQMTSEELLLLERVDGIPLNRKSWNPGQKRGRFQGD